MSHNKDEMNGWTLVVKREVRGLWCDATHSKTQLSKVQSNDLYIKGNGVEENVQCLFIVTSSPS